MTFNVDLNNLSIEQEQRIVQVKESIDYLFSF